MDVIGVFQLPITFRVTRTIPFISTVSLLKGAIIPQI